MTRPIPRPVCRLLVLLAATIELGLPGAARALPPPNDDCASAVTISALPFTDHVNIGEATAGAGDPAPSCAGGTFNSVWYRYTPTGAMHVALGPIDGSGFSVLAVYSGSCGAFVPVSCNQTPVTLNAGTTYLLELATTFSLSGTFFGDFTATRVPSCGDCVTDAGEDCDDCNVLGGDGCSPACATEGCGDGVQQGGEECDDGNGAAGDGCESCAVVQPANDACASPLVLTPVSTTSGLESATVNSLEASVDGGDPVHTCTTSADDHTVWFEYTSPVNGMIVFDLVPQSAAQVLSAYTGTCGGLAEEACNVGPPNEYAGISFPVEAGATYLIEASSAAGADDLTIESWLAAVCGDGTHAFAYGEDCDDGNLVDGDGCDSDCHFKCGNGVTEGTEQCDDGNAVNTDACTNACTNGSSNDECAAASTIMTTGPGNFANVGQATESASDPEHSCTSGADLQTVWFKYTATGDGNIRANLNTPSPSTLVLTVYTGTCGALTEVGCALVTGTNTLSFAAVNGVTYLFEVSSVTFTPDASAILTLSVQPPNDECSVPTVISTTTASGFVDLAAATESGSDPVHTCTTSSDLHTVWFSYVATDTGRLTVNAVRQWPPIFPPDEPVEPVLTVYAGDCGTLSEQSCGMGFGNSPATLSGYIVAGQSFLFEISASGEFPATYFSANASWWITFTPAFCGDGIADATEGEECDDGNGVETDACTSACQNAFCGDGILHDGVEDCDDANSVENDGCDNGCHATCGDGIQVGIEDCDDGNMIDGDDCDNECHRPCPHNLCNCLGAAGDFGVIAARSLQVKEGKYSEGGESEPIENAVSGSVCSASGKFGAKEIGTAIDGDLILTNGGPKVAATFSPIKFDGMIEPGTYVTGDVATGGGPIKGLDYLLADGSVTVDGSNSQIANCQQGVADFQAASTFLASRPPTQTLSEIIVDTGDEYAINLGPGVHVINVDTIKVVPAKIDGEPEPSDLAINFGPATETVIINVGKALTVGEDCSIRVTPGHAGSVILNLPAAQKLSLKLGALLDPVLLAPLKTIKLPLYSSTANVYTTGKMAVTGADIEDTLQCDE